MKLWLDSIGRNDLLHKCRPYSFRVCSIHFKADMFKNKRLIKDAVPSLHLPNTTGAEVVAGNNIENESAMEIQEPEPLSVIPEGKVIISSVFRFLKNEHQIMKIHGVSNCHLKRLADIVQRTAEATGVSELTVITLLEEEKAQKDLEQNAALAKRRKLDQGYDDNASVTESNESSNEGEDEAAGNNDGQEREFDIEVVKMEFEEDNYDFRQYRQRNTEEETVTEDLIVLHPAETSTSNSHLGSRVVPKTEPVDDENQQLSSAAESAPPDATLVRVKEEPIDYDTKLNAQTEFRVTMEVNIKREPPAD